jgi:DNA-binding NtrC family response regulator
MKQSILILASSAAEGARVKTCAGEMFSVEAVGHPSQAEMALAAKVYDLLLLDASYLHAAPQTLMADALRRGRARQVVILAAPHQFEQAIVAMRQGAVDVLSLPVQPDSLQQLLTRCLGNVASDTQLQTWRRRYAPEFIGDDPKIIRLLSMIKRIADTDCDVLITGASGTGKELIARCIHSASRRHKNPFVALNCAAIPKDLMESEIFGHSRGAFTGATERRSGKFEVAAGGTLFLDETGEMDLTMQSKFLRVIQEREVTPVGDSRTFKVDVRIVSATNQDLDTLRRDKLFREDLYYRLNVVPVHLPALAERPLDIPGLAQHFIERANRRHGRRVQGLSEEASVTFCSYAWPGNVRELQNLVERVVILKGSDGPIQLEDLPTHVTTRTTLGPLSELRLPEKGLDINETLALVETRLTLDALERAKGNKARAAELLGLKRTTLVERLKKLHFEEPLSRRD